MSENKQSCILSTVLPDCGSSEHVTDCVEHYNTDTIFADNKIVINSTFNDAYVRMSENYLTLSWRQATPIDG